MCFSRRLQHYKLKKRLERIWKTKKIKTPHFRTDVECSELNKTDTYINYVYLHFFCNFFFFLFGLLSSVPSSSSIGLFNEGLHIVLGGICTELQTYTFTTRSYYAHFTMHQHNRNLKKNQNQKTKNTTAAPTDVYMSKFTCVLNRCFATRLFGHFRRKGIHSKHFVKLSKCWQP